MAGNVLKFCENTLNFIRFLTRLCKHTLSRHQTLSNPIKKIYPGTIILERHK